jgi:hypothetical protein
MNKIPTHNPQTGELNPYYEELTGERNPLLPEEEIAIPTFDMKQLVGKQFTKDNTGYQPGLIK